ncbi:aldehyde dehydrogenase family protein [Streptomyces iranensis]|uniref:Aldehyde Dehydrogenase n=1 Tax=Streptomyces iranensis TaxID=576784 RepID=A0A061A0X3_9ACTN|nr:aldehyde dehydrogenase family protein [Streptomyces iranensis]MBP2060104.1 acyl-CoA reductase-like NAD-dependent aldehyde dehydrogenase [Streptomyces iranensis]CDR13964.1 Aldehyde Dehydrogenase [Streptomyces iranensis]
MTAPVTGRPVRSYGIFIDGAEVQPSAEFITRENPGTKEVVARFTHGDPAQAQAAVAAARRAFDEGDWPNRSGQERAAVLRALASLMRRDQETLARIDAEESGKPIRLARADVATGIALTEYAAALAVTSHGQVHTNLGPDFTGLVTREPCGVVAMITPWNFPLLLLMQKLPFALAAGCTTVCKPSELTSGSTLEIAKLAAEAGLPGGVFNVVTGPGSTVGHHLAQSRDVDVLSFTGSTAVGRSVVEASAGNLKRLSLELGGKAASVVFPDADLEDAVDGVLFAVLFNQGECCVSGARLLVHQDVADQFVQALVDRVSTLRVGAPLDEDADIGALIHAAHLDKVLASVDGARAEGARVVAGGTRLTADGLGAGYFMAPTIIDQVSPTSRLFSEEVFGPVLAISRFRTEDEAVELANAVEYGLANSVWSKNIDTALALGRRLRSGTVWVNTTIDGAPQLPGGGVKSSGYGREMGQAGFEEFTEVKTVQIRSGKRTPFFRGGAQ